MTVRMAIPIGSYLQSRRNVVPWYSASRGLGQLVYALTAVAVALVPASALVPVVLLLWAAVTIPTTIGSVAFNVVMENLYLGLWVWLPLILGLKLVRD